MDQNYSKLIREVTSKFLNKIDEYLSYTNSNYNKYEIFLSALKLDDFPLLKKMLKEFGLLTDYKERLIEVLKTCIYIQSYTDFYIIGRYQNLIEENDDEFGKIEYKIIEEFFNNVGLYIIMLDSMREFNNMSAYKKIILMKSMNEEDNKKLKNINPFYEYEKNKYDIEINKELILSQMSKWEKSFGFDRSLEETINFIFELNYLNPSNIIKLFSEFNIEKYKSEFIKNEETIFFNDIYINKDILKEVLIKEYDIKKKVKK